MLTSITYLQGNNTEQMWYYLLLKQGWRRSLIPCHLKNEKLWLITRLGMLWSAGCWNTLILYSRWGINLVCDLSKKLSAGHVMRRKGYSSKIWSPHKWHVSLAEQNKFMREDRRNVCVDLETIRYKTSNCKWQNPYRSPLLEWIWKVDNKNSTCASQVIHCTRLLFSTNKTWRTKNEQSLLCW